MNHTNKTGGTMKMASVIPVTMASDSAMNPNTPATIQSQKNPTATMTAKAKSFFMGTFNT